jgi:Carboxypeptidase regulatory-like domain
MKRLLSLLLFAASPLCAATISGTVTQSGAGTPLVGMTVQAYDPAGALTTSTTSDSAGHYTVTLPSGTYRVLAFDPTGVYATSFYADAESFETATPLALQTTLSSINLALVTGGTIAGTVTSTTGTALAAMTVAAYNPNGTRRGFTMTDAVGHYQLVLPPGTYTIAAYDDAQNYLTSFFQGASNIASASKLLVTASQTTTANMMLLRGAIVSGTVTDVATGLPIAGAQVSAYASDTIVATATTDVDGHYRLLLPPSTYRVVTFDPTAIYATGYAPSAESFDTSATFALVSGASQTVNAQLVRAGRLAGQISDASTGAGLSGITVAAFNSDGTTRGFTTTDATGAYTLSVPPGSYWVGAYDTNLVYLPRFAPNDIAFASALPSSVFASQTTTVGLALPRGAVVSGQVTSSFAVLSGIAVAAYNASGVIATSITDANGRYRLLLESGSYTIVAFDPAFHYATASFSTSVLLGQTLANQNVALVAGAHVSGTVMTPNGAGVGNLTVAAYDPNGAVVLTAFTRPDGAFDLMLAPGTYRFAAFDPQKRYTASPLTQGYNLSESQVAGGLDLRVTAVTPLRRRAVRA